MHIYSGDVRIGTIGVRAGVPVQADQWAWSIGFYPGMEPGAGRRGIAATFEAAREAFEAASSDLGLPSPTPPSPNGAKTATRAPRWRPSGLGARNSTARPETR